VRRGQSFPKHERLRKRDDYLRVQRDGRKVHSDHFLLLMIPPAESSGTRVGVTVSSRVGNAVTRNRIKRWVRELLRRRKSDLPPGEIVIVAKSSAAVADHPTVDRDLDRLIGRAKGIKP
jgi:ribonuclease P protein component